jgi:UDP-N-acetylglucosamine 2-epimerase
MKKILFCFGTRPEWLKIKSLIDIMPQEKYSILFTGQHVDLIKNIDIDHKIEIKQRRNRLDSILALSYKEIPHLRMLVLWLHTIGELKYFI